MSRQQRTIASWVASSAAALSRRMWFAVADSRGVGRPDERLERSLITGLGLLHQLGGHGRRLTGPMTRPLRRCPGVFVTWVAPLPSAFATQMSNGWPGSAMENATCLPSTDQAGWESLAPEGTWTGSSVALGPDSVMSTARMPAPVVARMRRSVRRPSATEHHGVVDELVLAAPIAIDDHQLIPVLVGEVDPDERDPQAVRGEIAGRILPSLR